ncbi:MAG: catalase family peroxidase [Anaerolineae bacterium]|nr:catalase family peroxidase [Phycisphaerae bacterium]
MREAQRCSYVVNHLTETDMTTIKRRPVSRLLILTLAGTAAGCVSTTEPNVMAGKPTIANATPVAAAAQTPPDQLVDALNGVFGKHKARGSHAKGFCMAGELEASSNAATITRASLFQPGKRTPIIGRFSVGGGNPKAADNGKSVRGIAVRAVDGNQRLDWIFISAPHFFAQTPEQFANFFKVRAPDSATGKMNPEAIAAFSKANPATTKQAAYLAGQPVPASYGTVPYFSTNTFIATNAAGKMQPLRWRFEPVAGRLGLTDDEAKAKGSEFLRTELMERLAKGPVVFNVIAQLARADDQLIDPTEPWPADRTEVNTGRLVIDRITDQACDRETFLPTVLPAGLATSADPILAARDGAYAVSLSRRLTP